MAALAARGLKLAPGPWRLPLLLGDCSEGVPPVPIPNTEVKPFSPDGTARASVWERRKLPGISHGPTERSGFCVYGYLI